MREDINKGSSPGRGWIAAGVLTVAFLIFFAGFYVSNVEVTGNSRYSAQEIEKLCLKGIVPKNSLLVRLTGKTVQPDKAFLKAVHFEYVSHNTIRLRVEEKKPAAYLIEDHIAWYFDQEGMVLEKLPESKAGQENTEKQASETADEEAETQPSIADLPRVKGLELTSKPEVGKKLKTGGSGVFRKIQELSKRLRKLKIVPDYFLLEKDDRIRLYYGTTKVELGDDSLMDEKLTHAASILPQIRGQAGTLHLEDYSSGTQGLIFNPESEKKENTGS